MAIGNEAQMAEIKAAMAAKEKADQVNTGDKARYIVPIDFTSLESGAHYKGKIEFKRPNVFEGMKMGGLKTQILKDAGIVDRELADDGVMFMATAMATLKVVVVRCPEWFIDIEKVADSDLVFHVYGEYLKWNDSFRPNGEGVAEGNSQPSVGA
jgi:hypothetical protein